MKMALSVIAIVWISLATCLIIYTEPTRGWMKKLGSTKNFKGFAAFPLIVGLFLVVGAFYYREMFWLALILGILALLKGIYFVIGPSHQVASLLEWWFDRASEATIRLFGLIAFLLGSALLSYLL